MASNESFDGDLLSGGGFSQLLDSGDVVGLDMAETLIYPSSFPVGNSPTMLCFEKVSGGGKRGFGEIGTTTQKSGITGSDSSSASSSNNSSNSSGVSKSKEDQTGEPKIQQKRGNGSGPGSGPDSGATTERRKTCKNQKTENPTSIRPVKVRKEKIGERITALQQLVSPFGKTDTASVLHEAMGYIRFLHEQVQVLSSPYLQRLPSSAYLPQDGGGAEDDEGRYDLRSRGLCLVPVASTLHVANSNGADFWSPAMGSKSLKH